MRIKGGVSAPAMLLIVVACLMDCRAFGQQGDTLTELQQLKSELHRIEQRIDTIEAEEAAAKLTAASPTAATPAQPPPPPAVAAETTPLAQAAPTGPEAVKQAAAQGMDTMDAGMGGEVIKIPHIPQMKFRGFGDVQFVVANQNLAVVTNSPGSPTPATQGGRSTFTLGMFDFFVTSQISESWSYLAEMGFQADTNTNGIGVDLERTQITYRPNQKFSMNFGRSHTMLGYYNTAFHHGTWFQTTILRPRFFEFEDEGGPLPVHNVGVEAMGLIPSGKLGFHWLAEVGNGKQTYALQAGPNPANVLADHTGKSTNIGFFIRPEKFNGLQAGFDWYQASLVPVPSLLPGYGLPGFPFPNAASYYHQNIFVAHVVYITPRFEFMVEDGEIGDTPRGSNQPLYTSGGYAQISKVLAHALRPYFRYEWMNPNFHDPNNAWAGHWVGPLAGLRWDFNPFVALKLEYQNTDWANFTDDPTGNQLLPILHKTINQVASQMTFTF
ncbi:MAG TPA: hypothetical protein VMB49_03465 [Acidobacteriaceae bacterium]|nr:hypothetical protein [Acidobacteriaceae bacterium]